MANEQDQQAERFLALREQLITTLGMDTVNILIQRSLPEVRVSYPALDCVRYDDGEQMHIDAPAEGTEGATPEAYAALNTVMLVLLARMLGREIAHRLAEGIEDAEFLEGRHVRER